MARQQDDYQSKRDFRRTPEPGWGEGERSGEPVFVIQEHQASSHHFDLRLEADGVLLSWAVPKGPSTDPSDKRLAIRTDDHPLAYADFEGVIPEGEYGAGAVIVWDTGPFENITEKDGEIRPVGEAVEQGHLLVRLHGEKLQGGYALQRTGNLGEGNWLLVKMDDDAADARRNPVSTEPHSVVSGKTVKQMAQEGDG